MNGKIKKAVFPVAGFGTRFLPATKAMPKELLPIVDKPLIQYAVEEAIAAGIDTLIFVTGRNKRAIEDHFDVNKELELTLRSKEKMPKRTWCAALFQRKWNVYLFARLNNWAWAMQVDKADISQHGVIIPSADGHGVKGMIEKPRQDEAPSNLASIGRYTLAPDIFDSLRTLPTGSGGEIQFADVLTLHALGGLLEALELKGKRFDSGTVDGFMNASAFEYTKKIGKLN